KAPWIAGIVAVLIGVGAYFLVESVPREYAPQEDAGQFNAQIQAPEGISYEQMVEAGLKAEAFMAPYFENGLIQRGVVAVPGWGNAAGIVNVTLRPWDERTISADELIAKLNEGWSTIPEVRINAFPRRSTGGGGGGGGGGAQPVQIVLGGPTYEELARWRDIIIDRASQNPGLLRIDSNLKETQPQVLVRVDPDRAASLGVSQRAIGQTLQTMMSERAVTTYVVDGEEYDVVLQAKPEQRATYSDLTNIFVRSERSGQLIPLANLVKLEDVAGPSTLNRHDRLRSVTISASL